MPDFEGIEEVEPIERQKQYALTEALWSELKKQGLSDGTPGNIECYFYAKNIEAVHALLPAFEDWQYEMIEPSTPTDDFVVRLVSPLVHLSEDSLLGLVDVSLIAAHQSTCTFDGFQVDTSGFRKSPWWKFW